MNVSATYKQTIETMVWRVNPVYWPLVINLSPYLSPQIYYSFWGSQFNHLGVRTVGGFELFGWSKHIANMTKATETFPRGMHISSVMVLEAHDSDLLPDNCCLKQSWWTLPAAAPLYPWVFTTKLHFPWDSTPTPLSAGLRCSQTTLKFETFYPKLPFLSPFTDVRTALWSHF